MDFSRRFIQLHVKTWSCGKRVIHERKFRICLQELRPESRMLSCSCWGLSHFHRITESSQRHSTCRFPAPPVKLRQELKYMRAVTKSCKRVYILNLPNLPKWNAGSGFSQGTVSSEWELMDQSAVSCQCFYCWLLECVWWKESNFLRQKIQM